MNNERMNWAGNYQYKARNLYQPRTIEEIQNIVVKAKKAKALGSRHCFNDIADCSEAQISTENFDKIVSFDERAMTVTIESGLRYGQLCAELNRRGFALHNLASLPHISVVGACATATHGSGVKNRNLAAIVSSIEFVSGTGDLIALTREKDGEKFNGAVVNLGGLGVVTKITLEIEKAYRVRQDCFENLSLDSLRENFETLMSAGYSVSLFTDWRQPQINQIWVKSRSDSEFVNLGDELCGAKCAVAGIHPIAGISAEYCTEQMGVEGDWYERLPHFRMEFTPSAGAELQSEYFVPSETAVEAFLALEKIRDSISPLLLISEIRTIARDELWLSPAYKQDAVGFHFTWKQDVDAVTRLLPTIEAALAPFDAKPHWGKVFTMPKQRIRSLYQRIPDFIKLLEEFDPQGKFRNQYLERVVF